MNETKMMDFVERAVGDVGAVLGGAMSRASPQARIAIDAALTLLSSCGIGNLPADGSEIIQVALFGFVFLGDSGHLCLFS